MKKNIFIIGSKGIPARYGGFETFVEKLTKYWKCEDIKLHISCPKLNFEDNYEYNDARCFVVKINKLGGFGSILYDLKSIKECINYISKNNLAGSIIYMLTYRIGPFLFLFKKKIKKHKICLYLNPDGLEYNRKKWNRLVKLYWKISRLLTIKYVDLIICDSKEIQKNLVNSFNKNKEKIIYIPYGAELQHIELRGKQEITNWFKNNNVIKNNYYLYVGRFVPENNIEFIIKEYIDSGSKKNLVLITNTKFEKKYYAYLNKKFSFKDNEKILLPGTVYGKGLLEIIRENAFAYIHGHEVGGTNPSLLEAMALTKINLVLWVAFNEEVCADSVLYFEKTLGSLKNLIIKIEKSDLNIFEDLSQKAKSRIRKYYTWEKIVKEYERIF